MPRVLATLLLPTFGQIAPSPASADPAALEAPGRIDPLLAPLFRMLPLDVLETRIRAWVAAGGGLARP